MREVLKLREKLLPVRNRSTELFDPTPSCFTV
jgi:hypothetical protein